MKNGKRVQKGEETNRQKLAFQYYYNLGADATHEKVAKKFGVSKVTVAWWSQIFEWSKRCSEMDGKVYESLVEKSVEDIAAMKADILSVVRFMFKKVVRMNDDGSIAGITMKGVRDVAELEKLVKLYLLIVGEPTERTEEEHYVHDDLSDVSEDTLRAIAAEGVQTEGSVRAGQA